METSMSTDAKDRKSEQDNSQDESACTPSQPTVITPKINKKKSLAREGSESLSTPNPIKVAKMSPRATRSSQNPDFAAKQRKFLNRVHDPIRRDNSDSDNSQGLSTPTSSKQTKEYKSKSSERKSDGKRKFEKDVTPKHYSENDDEGFSKKRRTKEPTKVVGGVDSYCWRCHRDGNVINCEICPRVYHIKCVQMETAPPNGWMCPECSTVTQAENTDTRSRAMRMLTLDQLCNLLRFALNRMTSHEGSEDFAKPVDLAAFPYYRDFIVKPMDLSQLKQNIKNKMYGSTEAFLADAKWIVHNSIIFNSVQSKFTNTARALLKICRQEMQEIENCPDCYQNAHTRSSDSWFIEACRRPHLLVWAKLKGFPFWPAKAMNTNSDNFVDVRFFGAHDRAWVPLSSCFLFSKLSPAPTSNKSKRNLEECLQELECHIKKLKDKFGPFEYPPYKTQYDPTLEDEQLAMFLPMYEAKGPGKRQLRISLHHDGARKALLQKKSSQSPSMPENTSDNSTKLKDSPLPRDEALVENPTSEEEKHDPKSPMVMIFTDKVKPNKHSLASPNQSISLANPPKVTSRKRGESERRSSPADQAHTPTMAHKTPLTAAAKKCFATKDRTCVRCQTNASASWHETQNGDLCATCRTPQTKAHEKLQIQGKSCAACYTSITMTWLTDSAGRNLCSSCGFADQLFEKNEQADNPSSTIRGTVTVQRKLEVVQSGSEEVAEPEKREIGKSPGAPEDGAEEMAGALHPSTIGDTPILDFGAVDSPPKFIIPKASGSISPESTKKVSIVDRLQEKLCFVVEEAIKDHLTTEESKTTAENIVAEAETVSEKTTDPETSLTTNKGVMKVLLHDLKGSEEMKAKITPNTQNKNKSPKDTEVEIQSSSESNSEPDTDASSAGDCDNFVANDESTKKKKDNINNVVKTLKERKSSVDERIEQNNKDQKGKESSTVMLDDSNEEVPVLIIDEGEYNSGDSKRSSGKLDKNRRKGIPAKIFSRSSTSTEASEVSSPEEKSNSSKIVEVLDEVSGQFRRSSDESKFTITLVTDNTAHQKKTGKEIRSVNISKSLSLSVINESSASLEMECVGSDLDDQVIVDSVIKKVNPGPTARKTLPNPPREVDLTNTPEDSSLGKHNKDSEPEVMKEQTHQGVVDSSLPPPLLMNVRQAKMSGAGKVLNQIVTAAASQKPSTVRTSASRAQLGTANIQLGTANTQLEEAVNKMSGQLRSVLEEVLRDMSEAGSSEATVKALQMELERLQWRHRQEISELKHNTDLVVLEMRASMEADKQRALLDAKHKFEMDKEQAVQEVKRKQWCAFCLKEAQLYCCWNTSYCSYNCQQSHWMPHMSSCMNKQGNSAEMGPRAGLPRPPYNMSPQGQVGYLNNNS